MKRLNRQSIRLRGHDYTSAAVYFVTICTRDLICLFGEIEEGRMVLNQSGAIAEACWREIPAHFPRVILDAHVIMPNHLHGLIEVVGTAGATAAGATHASPLHARGPERGSLGAVIGSYKSAVTRHINRLWNAEGQSVWQRNYHDRIIRGERGRFRVRRYVARNPVRWYADRLRVDG